MTAQVLIDAFRLPAQALVGQRIPKKLLVEQGAPTAADKRLINDTVDELCWQATLKPGTVGVPASAAASANAGDATDVIELAVVSAQLRPPTREAQARRLMQLVHRAVPYPVLLAVQTPAGTVLSLAQKRSSLGKAGKWVVVDGVETHAFDPTQPTAAEAQFMASLSLDQLPPSAVADLRALYQAVAARVTALAVAEVTGQFKTPEAVAGAATTGVTAQRGVLAERSQLLDQLASARNTAAKARQMSQRVELNLQIQRLQRRLQELQDRLAT
ncbi:MAG: DUF4391 domain-containing protein [Betaproteobacteria bacterium]